MPEGTIQQPLHSKGYGFIVPDDGSKDVFLHVSELIGGSEADLVPGTRVSYKLRNGRRGPEAVRAEVISGGISTGSQPDIGEAGVSYDTWEAAMREVIQRHVEECVAELVALFGWGQ